MKSELERNISIIQTQPDDSMISGHTVTTKRAPSLKIKPATRKIKVTLANANDSANP